MDEPKETVGIVCNHCGATLSAFLRQMAVHNQQIVCPQCGRQHQVADLRRSSHRDAASPKKT